MGAAPPSWGPTGPGGAKSEQKGEKQPQDSGSSHQNQSGRRLGVALRQALDQDEPGEMVQERPRRPRFPTSSETGAFLRHGLGEQEIVSGSGDGSEQAQGGAGMGAFAFTGPMQYIGI